jgi:hypothetical protein
LRRRGHALPDNGDTPLGRSGQVRSCEAGRSRISGCRPEYGSLWDDALGRKLPQCDQELPRKGNDHDLAHATCSITKAVAKPTDDYVLRLAVSPDPGKLH